MFFKRVAILKEHNGNRFDTEKHSFQMIQKLKKRKSVKEMKGTLYQYAQSAKKFQGRFHC